MAINNRMKITPTGDDAIATGRSGDIAGNLVDHGTTEQAFQEGLYDLLCQVDQNQIDVGYPSDLSMRDAPYDVTVHARIAALEAGTATPTYESGSDLSGPFNNPQIVADAVTNVELADNAVQTAKIADDAVTNAKIADDAVNTVQILDDAVTTAKILNNAVTMDKIGTAAVGTTELADDAVTAVKITDGVVSNAKLTNDSISYTVGANTATEVNLGETGNIPEFTAMTDGVVTGPTTVTNTSFLRDDNTFHELHGWASVAMGDTREAGPLIPASRISSAISSHTVSAAITGTIPAYLALAANRNFGLDNGDIIVVTNTTPDPDEVSTWTYNGASVTASVDATGTFTQLGQVAAYDVVPNGGLQVANNNFSIADSGVTTARINDLAVTTAKLAVDAVDGTKIADDAIANEHIAANSIDSTQIQANQITTAKIAPANVTEEKLDITNAPSTTTTDPDYFLQFDTSAQEMTWRTLSEVRTDLGLSMTYDVDWSATGTEDINDARIPDNVARRDAPNAAWTGRQVFNGGLNTISAVTLGNLAAGNTVSIPAHTTWIGSNTSDNSDLSGSTVHLKGTQVPSNPVFTDTIPDFSSTVTGSTVAVGDLTSISTSLNRDGDPVLTLTNANGSYVFAGGGGASVDVSTSQPANPSEGDLWFDSMIGRLFVWCEIAGDANGGAWIDANAAGVGDTNATLNIVSALPTDTSGLVDGTLYFDETTLRAYLWSTTAMAFVDIAPAATASADNLVGTAGTDGQILTSDGAGGATWEDAAATPTIGTVVGANGDAGQILTSDGDGTATWADAASGGGGAWNYLGTLGSLTAGASTVNVEIDNTEWSIYDAFVIVGYRLQYVNSSTVSANLRARMLIGAGSTYETSGYNYVTHGYRAANTTLGLNRGTGSSQHAIMGPFSNTLGKSTTEQSLNFTMYIPNPRSTTKYCGFYGTMGGQDGSANNMANSFSASINNVNSRNNALRAVQIYSATGTLQGLFHLYGIQTSSS